MFLLSYLLLYTYPAIVVIFFISALILPLPDNTVLLAAGAFASQGYLNFWLAGAVATAASMGGDLVGYLLARRYGKQAAAMLRIKIPWYIDALERYVRKHPGTTIFVTRYVGTIDSLVNLLSGFIEIPLTTFLLWDFLGNASSNLLVMFLGYIMGDYWVAVSGIVETVGWVLLVLVVLAVVVIIWGKRLGIDGKAPLRRLAHRVFDPRKK